jgi:hypothetical protein
MRGCRRFNSGRYPGREGEREGERDSKRTVDLRLLTLPPSLLPSLRPWAVNLAGIPIWCTFGPVEAGAIGRRLGNASAGTEMSTARVMPFMRQEKNVLHAVYLSASCGLAMWNRNLRPCVRWLEEEMEVGSPVDTPFFPSFFPPSFSPITILDTYSYLFAVAFPPSLPPSLP